MYNLPTSSYVNIIHTDLIPSWVNLQVDPVSLNYVHCR
jgi:hypothetical protein